MTVVVLKDPSVPKCIVKTGESLCICNISYIYPWYIIHLLSITSRIRHSQGDIHVLYTVVPLCHG